jgi:hypothetical protein
MVRLWTGAPPLGEMECMLSAVVRNRIYLGDHTEYALHTDSFGEVLARVAKSDGAGPAAPGPQPGQTVTLGWRRESSLALGDT